MSDPELETVSPSSRRSPREVAMLEARVLALLTACPGMTRLEAAMQLEVEASAIRRPITNLLHAGRIRRQGHKTHSRYWPTDPGPLNQRLSAG